MITNISKMNMKYDFFLSHRNDPVQKEFAKAIYYNAMVNNVSIWYDEDRLSYGDNLNDIMRKGIENSSGFLLINSKEAMKSKNILFEMGIAKQKYEIDLSFKLFVIKMDNEVLDEFWSKFLYMNVIANDFYSNVVAILEGITGKKIIAPIQAMSILSVMPSFIFDNKNKTILEHSRNFMLYYFGLVKQLINSVVVVGDFMPHTQNEHQDTLKKLLSLSLLDKLPNIQNGIIPIGNGEIEIIHSTRMRIKPKVIVNTESRYRYEIICSNEIFTRIKFFEQDTNEIVNHAIPFTIDFDAEL